MTPYEPANRFKQELQRRVEALESALALYEQYHWEIGRQVNVLVSERQQLLESLQRICESEQLYLRDD